jgi:hypothetical protein
MRQKVRWNTKMSIALFFIEKLFFSVFIGVCGLFLNAMKNAMKIFFAVA